MPLKMLFAKCNHICLWLPTLVLELEALSMPLERACLVRTFLVLTTFFCLGGFCRPQTCTMMALFWRYCWSWKYMNEDLWGRWEKLNWILGFRPFSQQIGLGLTDKIHVLSKGQEPSASLVERASQSVYSKKFQRDTGSYKINTETP